MYKFLTKISNIERISLWKSKGLSNEIFKALTTFDNSLTPSLRFIGNIARVKFDRSGLKQNKIILILIEKQ